MSLGLCLVQMSLARDHRPQPVTVSCHLVEMMEVPRTVAPYQKDAVHKRNRCEHASALCKQATFTSTKLPRLAANHVCRIASAAWTVMGWCPPLAPLSHACWP